MEDAERRLLRALEQSLAGNTKGAAMTVWPGLSETSAASRLSRVFSGELAIPPLLFVAALRGVTPQPLMEFVQSEGSRDAGEVLTDVRERLDDLGRRLADAVQMVAALDGDELSTRRRGPHRVRPRGEERRRPA